MRLKIPFLLLFIGILLQGFVTMPFNGTTDPAEPEENIRELTRYFEKKGYAFQELLQDSRFVLVEDITGKFTRAAEIRIDNFRHYQEVIGFERKKEKVWSFMKEHEQDLIAAEANYGIPRHVIAGIIGIESEFGRYKGSYNPFNAYVSMYAEGHRSKFARAQLEELLIFVKKHDLDVFDLESSYAGAMSYAQFIPWSLNRYWVGNDLYHMPDNIRSVANYLAHYKKVTGSLEKAILRYNPSSLYQEAVLALAEEAKKLEETK